MRQLALLTLGLLVMGVTSGCYHHYGYQRGPGLFGGPGLFNGGCCGAGACGPAGCGPAGCPNGACGTGYMAPGGVPGAVPGAFYGPHGSATQTSYPTAANPMIYNQHPYSQTALAPMQALPTYN